MQIQASHVHAEDSSTIDSEMVQIRRIFGVLFLKLLSKNHVTDSAIQEVVEALGTAAGVQERFLKKKVADLSNELNLDHFVPDRCLKGVANVNLLFYFSIFRP